MAAILEGVLVAYPDGGLAVDDGNGTLRRVQWPDGYREEGQSLIGPDGAEIARVQDRIVIGGGETSEGTWVACPDKEVVKASASATS